MRTLWNGLAWQEVAGCPAPIVGITEKQAEIKAVPWHAGPAPDERKRRIVADVDRWWHLEVKEAARRLLDRFG